MTIGSEASLGRAKPKAAFRAQSSTERYDATAQALHWLIAALIFTAVPLGWIAVSLPRANGAAVIALHKSVGVTILALMLVRLGWRLAHKPPPMNQPMAIALFAKASHWLLYIVFLLQPISGFIQSSSGGHSVSFFGLFELPHLPKNKALGDIAQQVHLTTQWAVYGFVILHIAAVVWHVAVKRDGVLNRVLPEQDAT